MPPHEHPYVIGLTGGVGSGKSTVAGLIARVTGGLVHDSDLEVRRLLLDPGIVARVRSRFGDDVADAAGQLRRERLANIVFAPGAESSRRDLEAILHPELRRMLEATLRQARLEGVPVVILDAPLLHETGLSDRCHWVLHLETPEAARDARVRETRGWGPGERARREATQMSQSDKRARAHDVLQNDGDLQVLESRLVAMLSARGIFARGPSELGPSARTDREDPR